MKHLPIALALLACSTLGSCVSWFLAGGQIVTQDYQADIIIDYDTEGPMAAGISYSLVRTQAGEAIFERSADGSGTLFTNHWNLDGEDHFGVWVRRGPGYEVVIPEDRTQPGRKYIYLQGDYTVQEIDGVKRAVPTIAIKPTVTLIPR